MADNHRLFRRFVHKLFVGRLKLKLDRPQLFWWLAAGGYLGLTLAFFISPLTRVNHVDCVIDQNQPCPDFVVPELLKSRGKLIYPLKLEDLANQIKPAIPSADTISIHRTWPNRLTVQITSLPPVANLTIPASTSALLVNPKYYVLEQVDSPQTHLPSIIASAAASITLGDRITDASIIAAIDVISFLKNIDTVVIASPLEIQVTSNQNYQYLFTSNKSILDQLNSLQLILGQTTINPSTTIYDLRYDHPVLKQSW